MNDIERDDLLANCLEDIHRRRALGENPAPEEYRNRLGDSQAEFVDILDASDAIDQAMAPPVEDPLPRAFGRYTLTSELGRGSMGVVYEAFDRDLLRTVAVKILRTGFDTEPTAVERFRREARLCAQVEHDHIVKIYDHGEIEGRPYYTMSRLHGSTLAALIKAGQAPAPRDLAKGLAGIADGLHLLHTLKSDGKPAGIVHRDVKPSNILVEEKTGRYVLCDFGLARNFDSGKFTKTGEAVGTPLYMPPEQMLGKKEEVDARSDVYGLGATMYEALAGQPPFKTDEPSALWGMILTQRPRSLHELVDGLDSDCEMIVRKSLEKRREDRHASAAEMRDDLNHFAAGEPITNFPPTRLTLLVRRAKRYSPAIAAGLVLAVGGFYYWTHRDATVSVTGTEVGSRVSMDGEPPSAVPYVRQVSPGSHAIDISSPIFGNYTEKVVLEANEKWNLVIPPVIRDTGNPRALDWAEKQTFEQDLGSLEEPRTERGTPGEDTIDVLYPRGDVRLEDLKDLKYRVDSPDTANTDGTIEFRLGAKVLSKELFTPKTVLWEKEIPADVRKELKSGVKITWGFYPAAKQRKPSLASFQIVEKDLSKDIAKIDKKMFDQPGTIRALLRARLYLNRQLFTSALVETLRVLEVEKANVNALAIVHEALTRMRLDESRLLGDVELQLKGAPADKKAVLYRKR